MKYAGKDKPSAANGARKSRTECAPEEWQKLLQSEDGGQTTISNLANVVMALRKAPALVGMVAYDEMMRYAVLTRPVPDAKMPNFRGLRPVTDADVAAVQEWLQRHELRRVGKELVHQAFDLVAHEHGFHPVQGYLTGVKWDGVKRLDTWLTTYVGVADTSYSRGIARMFLISMVARIRRPGCKCDYMLILEGEQSAGKSTVCAILGDAWFSDGLPELHHGDAVRLSMHLRGKWIIEIAEMHSFGRAEAGTLKAFLTQREERYTPKFARNEVIEPRQCVFMGTTNKTAYLRDETGGRRFWPVMVGTIDTAALIRDRDQLFAEAMAAFIGGEAWWPDAAFEKEHITPEQEARFEGDVWETKIAEWLAACVTCALDAGCLASCTVAEVASAALGIEIGRVGTADQRRIVATMERLRWWQKRGTAGARRWLPPIG